MTHHTNKHPNSPKHFNPERPTFARVFPRCVRDNLSGHNKYVPSGLKTATRMLRHIAGMPGAYWRAI